MDSEFWISELTDDDVPAVVALCRTALDLPEDAAEAAEIVLRLRETTGTAGWSATPRKLAGFIALRSAGAGPAAAGAALSGEPVSVTGGRVIGVVLGSVSHRDRSIGHVDLVAVDPRERRRGVARALVSRVEGALAGLGAGDIVIAGNAPYYAWPGIDVRYTPAICAAMAFGFEQDQPAWNMTVDTAVAGLESTADHEERLAGEGITVRRAGAEDVPALVSFALATFGGGWAGEITHSVGRDQAGCHLALAKDGSILGFAAYGSSRPSWFGPMGTATAARGLGIGALLLRRCLADQRAAGHETVQIGWVGPLPFYSKAVGARVERVFLLYRKQL
ncbi:GNAT family N-acetyltransferase [Actinoplanes friuliensis]|uniref:GCN5-like N-acetyltransferase n=1 Tax=Actinoplanes friuliensis DSM 7358 TaxID=1246995 RepID=U5WBA5_9ACTN|nr:GNAT family N-acetyltransferase [Actinoplanes friuliensis]AGZ46429.1 GCN5-like N-acetyltransferase [Actinoplanes friuliensis DSM 7358]